MSEEKLISFKGTDKDMKCRGGFQYKLGEDYSVDGDVQACANGFHACERPLDVFDYFPPAESRFFRVEQSGKFSRDNNDSKIASQKIKLLAEIGVPGLVKAQVEYVKAHTTTEQTDPNMATAGSYGAATSRGSVCVGENGCGLVRGNGVMAKGGKGAILVICVENDDHYDVQGWKAVVVDGEIVKEDTWYTVKNGKLREVEPDDED